MVRFICFSIVMLVIFSCNAQSLKISRAESYDLEQLSYKLNAREFVIENENDLWSYQYDTLAWFIDSKERSLSTYLYVEDQIPWGIYYSHLNWNYSREVEYIAKYGPMRFYGLNMITDLDNNLLAIGGDAADFSSESINETIRYLNNLWGNAKVSQSSFFDVFYIYTWEDGQSVIKLCTDMPVLKTEDNVSENTTIVETDHFARLLFVKKEYAKDITDKLGLNSFLYFKEGKPLDDGGLSF